MSGFGMGHNKLFGFADQQGRFVRTERTDGNVLQKTIISIFIQSQIQTVHIGSKLYARARNFSIRFKECVDINECSFSTTCGIDAGVQASCANTIGSFECTCNTGFEQIGSPSNALHTDFTCNDVDECQNNPCGKIFLFKLIFRFKNACAINKA